MIELEKTITIQAPPYTDQNDKVITPEPQVVDKLDVLYHIHPEQKMAFATFSNVPGRFMLYQGEDYENNQDDINITSLTYKLLMVLGDDIETTINNQFPKTLEQDPDRPGSILTSMIKTIGIKSSSNCSCRRHALEMNEKGPDWCEQNIDTILSWLKEESQKRKLPYVEFVAKSMVQRAIYKSRKLIAKNQEDSKEAESVSG